MKNEKETGFIGQVFEIFFIMALCFATLFASMLLNGPVIVGNGATGKMNYLKAVTPQSVTIIVIILAVYLIYLLKKSDSELRAMIAGIYDNKEVNSGGYESEKL